MKNPRTHIEKEKALYTDYEIELKVSLILVLFWLLINTWSQFVGQLVVLVRDDFECLQVKDELFSKYTRSARSSKRARSGAG